MTPQHPAGKTFNVGEHVKTALVLLALSCCLSAPGLAQTDALTPCEQSLFSHAYSDEPVSKRLERLESTLFGDVQSGSETERTNRVVRVMSSARQAVPNAGKTESSDAPSNNQANDQSQDSSNPALESQAPAPVYRQPDATDYPKVTAIEREVFGRDFIRDDIGTRLGRLEKKVFGQPYPQMQLVDRVDKLLDRYPNAAPPVASREEYPNSAINDLPSSSSQFAGSSRDVYTKVDAMERRVLNGKTYPNQLLTERLDRLENQVYGKDYGGESVDHRVDRLMRNFEVASSRIQQRPAFQSRPSFQPAPYQSDTGYNNTPSPNQPPPPARQNIQIGGGFSENSTTRYSQEMLDMLPPNIRSQLSGQQITSNSGSGRVVSAPGSVVIERSTISSGYPGFQTYGGAPIQYYNYYGAPQTQSQTQTTTTVIQPDGSTAVYSYAGGPANGLPQGSPNPVYVGDPAFLQNLGNLEANIFGQVNMMEPPYVRLGKLEMAVLGQMYVGYPEAQRLSNLQRAYQLQSVSRLLGKGKAADIGRNAGSAMLGLPLTPPTPAPGIQTISPLGVPTH